MKLRLSTKYIRIRVAIWVSVIVALVFLCAGIKVISESLIHSRGKFEVKTLITILIEDKTLYLVGLGLIFGLIAFAGIQTYRENHLEFDKKRWGQKGFKAKLEVLGDWIIK